MRLNLGRITARLWFFSVISGLLQLLPFPIAGPVPLWRTAFAWVALLPLLYALVDSKKASKPLTLLQGTLLGYVCGVTWYAGNCYWIYQTMYLYGGLPRPVSLAILVLFALYLGLYHALFAFLVVAFRRSGLNRNLVLLLSSFAWVAVELGRARITGFPWDLLGYTQIDNPVLTRLASMTGVYGISFVVALVNALWLMRITVRNRKYRRPMLTAAGVVIFAGYVLALRAFSVPKEFPSPATATLVQENLSVGAERKGPPETQQQMLDAFTHLSTHPSPTFLAGTPELKGTPEVITLHKGASDAPEGQDQTQSWTPKTDLIVWPEAPAGFFTNDPDFTSQMHALADTSKSLLIVGSLGLDGNPDRTAARRYFLYDSAAYFTPGTGRLDRYDKVHLVPWGEYIPFKDFFFFARKLTAGAGDMDPGKERIVLSYAGQKYATFICYESIFGNEVRQFAKDGAQVLVNISDDGWYGDTGAAWQHLNMVRMRAIENHRWILRSTNTGVTAAIDPSGRITMAAPRHERTSLHAAFGYETDTTFYTAYGDLFAYICLLVSLAALVLGKRSGVRPPLNG